MHQAYSQPPSVCVSGKNAYVIEPKWESTWVTKYTETGLGFRRIGSAKRLDTHLLGYGPGKNGSLLLLVGKSGDMRVERIAGGSPTLVCKFRGETLWSDPLLTLSETSDGLMLQSLRIDDWSVLRIWLYNSSWAGPLTTDGTEYKFPSNYGATISAQRGFGRPGVGEYSWDVAIYHPNATISESKLTVNQTIWEDGTLGSARPSKFDLIDEVASQNAFWMSLDTDELPVKVDDKRP